MVNAAKFELRHREMLSGRAVFVPERGAAPLRFPAGNRKTKKPLQLSPGAVIIRMFSLRSETLSSKNISPVVYSESAHVRASSAFLPEPSCGKL